jgi:hypothetical protein
MRLGDPTQHKFTLLNKTDLSPARETLENAADAVDRMKQTKTFKNSQPTIRALAMARA